MRIWPLLESLPGGIQLAIAPPQWGDEVLLTEELAAAAAHAGRRRRQFATARHLARLLMRRCGLVPAQVGVAANGAPLWPSGCTGSISHAADLVAVALSADEGAGTDPAIGLDIERIGRIGPELWPTLFSSEEIANLGLWSQASQAMVATTAFCLKEAFLKLPGPDLPAFDLPDLHAVPAPARPDQGAPEAADWGVVSASSLVQARGLSMPLRLWTGQCAGHALGLLRST